MNETLTILKYTFETKMVEGVRGDGGWLLSVPLISNEN
jgi:hypothetical protein